MNAADSGGPWATAGVLVEKSKPCLSSKGDMYSRWKLSDLDGEPTSRHSIIMSQMDVCLVHCLKQRRTQYVLGWMSLT